MMAALASRRLRFAAIALTASFTIACGPGIELENSDTDLGATTSEQATPSSGDAGATSTETGASVASTSADGSTDAGSGTGSDASSTGGPDLLSESAYAGLQCNDGDPLPRLMLEAYFSDERPESCAPPPDINDDFFLAIIPNWDGDGGTFQITEDGPNRAAVGFGKSGVTGVIELEVNAPYELVTAHVQIDDWMEGDLDFSRCLPAIPDPFCE